MTKKFFPHCNKDNICDCAEFIFSRVKGSVKGYFYSYSKHFKIDLKKKTLFNLCVNCKSLNVIQVFNSSLFV